MRFKSIAIGIGVFVLGIVVCVLFSQAFRENNGYLAGMSSTLYLSGVIATFIHAISSKNNQ